MTTRIRKGAYGGRWEVYDDTLHLGWVDQVKPGKWEAFVALPHGVTGRQVGWSFPTRREAVIKVANHREVWD